MLFVFILLMSRISFFFDWCVRCVISFDSLFILLAFVFFFWIILNSCLFWYFRVVFIWLSIICVKVVFVLCYLLLMFWKFIFMGRYVLLFESVLFSVVSMVVLLYCWGWLMVKYWFFFIIFKICLSLVLMFVI